MKYNTFIFDLDGTLLDTLKDLQVAVNHALKKFGYAEKTYEQIRTYVGNGIAKLIERSVPDGLKNENFELLGEIIVVIDGNKNSAFISELSDEDIQHLLLQKMSQNISKKDAVKQVSKENNINKNRVYDISINL